MWWRGAQCFLVGNKWMRRDWRRKVSCHFSSFCHFCAAFTHNTFLKKHERVPQNHSLWQLTRRARFPPKQTKSLSMGCTSTCRVKPWVHSAYMRCWVSVLCPGLDLRGFCWDGGHMPATHFTPPNTSWNAPQGALTRVDRTTVHQPLSRTALFRPHTETPAPPQTTTHSPPHYHPKPRENETVFDRERVSFLQPPGVRWRRHVGHGSARGQVSSAPLSGSGEPNNVKQSSAEGLLPSIRTNSHLTTQYAPHAAAVFQRHWRHRHGCGGVRAQG